MAELNEAESQFIETMGLFCERMGFPRIGGRMLAWLMIAQEPQTLDDIAVLLKVSKASVSTNARHFVTVGMVDLVTRLGDRRTYYQWSPKAWDRRMELAQQVLRSTREFAKMGLAAIGPENDAGRARLEETITFANFFEGKAAEIAAEWEARRGRR